MTAMTQLLTLEIYSFMTIFLRVGSAILVMPGFMVSYVNMRQRLSIALTLSLILIPLISARLPLPSQNFGELIKICLCEITYGLFLGLCMQFLYAALSLVGNFAGQAIGFSNAQMFDPTFQTQSIILETFLSIIALTIIFITDLHHLMISAVVDSYSLFPIGSALPVDNFAEFLSKSLNNSFIMGFKIASPFIAFTIIFYTGMGLISRLMPQLNIFFLSLPLQIYLGLGLLFMTVPIIIVWFTKYYEEGLFRFVK